MSLAQEGRRPKQSERTLEAGQTISDRRVFFGLAGITAFSIVLRMLLVSKVQAPTVFSDEIGYQKLAQSIGLTGHLALFNDRGLSYAPLYPAVLSPIYALGASAPTAYTLIKIVNAILMSLAIVPTYMIARFVLRRDLALLVAALSIAAPLMFLSSFSMSENLAYPLCLVAFWALLVAIERPSAWHDAALLGSIVLACLARTQLVVLFPVAVTAIVVAALLTPKGNDRARAVRTIAREHLLLVITGIVGLTLIGIGVLAGFDILSITGRYSNAGRRSLPNVWHFLNLLIRHLAGVDLAVGVVPFVAAIVVAVVFLRSNRRPAHVAFASVAVCVTAWLLVEVAYDAAVFDSPTGDIPRIHERFLIYVMPFFLTALVAAYQYAQSKAWERIYLAAASIAALLPLVIPYDVVVNNTISFESLGLEPLGRVSGGVVVAVPHATLVALWLAGTLAFLYVRVRQRLRTVVLLLLVPFLAASVLGRMRIEATSAFARSLLPKHTDWVDRKNLTGEVVLLTGRQDSTSALQTAYANLSIDRVYAACRFAIGGEFGEEKVVIGPTGLVRSPSGIVRANYAVAPASLGVEGRLVARNRPGREVLVALKGGRLSVRTSKLPLKCSRPRGA